MLEYAGFRVGNFTSPLTASTTNSLLEDADPALQASLDFYAAVLAIHLGARFDAAVVAAERPELVGKIVSQKIPYNPVPLPGGG